LRVAQMAAVRQLADAYGLAIHLDGARVFNAAVALGVDVREITAQVDSVQACLSKGLAAPVGSLIVGPAEFIAEARHIRKMVGGGMRQAGVIAAAGIVALETMVDRLVDDHANARLLAERLAELPGWEVNVDAVQSNIVMIGLSAAGADYDAVGAALASQGVKVSRISATKFRAVTHYGIERSDIETAAPAFKAALAAA